MQQKDPIHLLGLLPGLEQAKKCIEEQIAEIRGILTAQGIQPNVVAEKKITRNISEDVRQQRREFLAKAREAKLARLYAAKAGLKVSEPADAKEDDQHNVNKHGKGVQAA